MHSPLQLSRALVGLGLLLGSACAPTQPAAPPAAAASAPGAPAAAAKATGKLSVYSALNESTNNAFVDAFKKAHARASRSRSCRWPPPASCRPASRTEKASPKADIFIGGSSEFHDPLGKEGLLEALQVAQRRRRSTRSSRTPRAAGPAGTSASSAWSINKDRWAKEMAGKADARDLGRPAERRPEGQARLPRPGQDRRRLHLPGDPGLPLRQGRGEGAGLHEEAPRQHRPVRRHVAAGHRAGRAGPVRDRPELGPRHPDRRQQGRSRSSSRPRPTPPTRSARSASSRAARTPPAPRRSSTGC